MAIFHIKANDGSSRDVASGDALNEIGPGSLTVDAGAYLISENLGNAAHLTGAWSVVINGAVEAFHSFGLLISPGVPSDVSSITIGRGGDVSGDVFGVELKEGGNIVNKGTISSFSGGRGINVETSLSTSISNSGSIQGFIDGVHSNGLGALTIVNRGTIGGLSHSIAVDGGGQAHVTNSGTLLGRVFFSAVGDIFTDFQKVGNVIKNGNVVGEIDLGDGADHFNGGANAETVRDGGGADLYKFGGGNDTYLARSATGTLGLDTIDGGKGRDTYDAAGATFTVLVNLDTKAHGTLPAQFAQGSDVGDVGNTDTVIGFENAVGGSAADLLCGSSGANTLSGGAGTDDLVGLGGRDILTGGADADRFLFQKFSDSGVTASTRDLITDFTQGSDHMNLVDLEASVGHGFTFIGNHHFHHTAGELRESYGGGNTIVSGDTNGDGKADFSIELTGHFALTSGDFTL